MTNPYDVDLDEFVEALREAMETGGADAAETDAMVAEGTARLIVQREAYEASALPRFELVEVDPLDVELAALTASHDDDADGL